MKSLNGAAVVAAWGALAAGGAAHAQEAVQWRVEDGGNGHWYQEILFNYGECPDCPQPTCQINAQSYAQGRGGYLATLNSVAEGDFLGGVVQSEICSGGGGLWIGLFYASGSVCNSSSWAWIDGSPITDEVFAYGGTWCNYHWEQESNFKRSCNGSATDWSLNNVACTNSFRAGLIIEWSADCNGDGIVDYGQILDGSLEDVNGNGVPDCCDDGVDCDPCVGDVNFDGVVNGADISVLLGFWGLNGKPVAADINKDGQVDGADLAQMLGSWGECP